MDKDPVELEEPERFEAPDSVWMRGLFMLVIALMFALAEAVLWVLALVQWLWMIFNGEKNELLVNFGHDLSLWVRDAARFQSGATEEKPFPWKGWGE